MFRFGSLVFIILFAVPSEARIFSFSEQGFGAYLEGSIGTNQIGQDPFAANLGSDVSISEEYAYTQSGKFGIAYNLKSNLVLMAGFEYLKPQSITGASGKNNSGTELYLFSSSARGHNPIASFEYTYRRIKNLRYFLGGGFGMGEVIIDNKFEINSTGQSELGLQSYNEKIYGTAMNGYLSIGLEAHFVDTSTFVIQAGHRLFKVHEFKHKSEVTTLSQGAVSDGDIVLNEDGSKRKADFSGPFISVGFRFYIP